MCDNLCIPVQSLATKKAEARSANPYITVCLTFLLDEGWSGDPLLRGPL